MPAEVWRQKILSGESQSVPVRFPDDWNAAEDLFYLEAIWIDGNGGSAFVVLSEEQNPDILDDSVGYWFDYYGGKQDFPNALVLAKGYAFIGVSGYGDGCVVSFFGNRKTSKANPDLALVTFGKAIFDVAPTV